MSQPQPEILMKKLTSYEYKQFLSSTVNYQLVLQSFKAKAEDSFQSVGLIVEMTDKNSLV